MKRAVLSGLLLPLAIGTSAPLLAATPDRAGVQVQELGVEPPCPADDRPAQGGLRAFIDPRTGELREPTPEEAQALSRRAREALARAVQNLEAVLHPDGTISVDLQGLFMQDLVVVKGPDGSISMRCVPDSERAVALATPAPAKPVVALEER